MAVEQMASMDPKSSPQLPPRNSEDPPPYTAIAHQQQAFDKIPALGRLSRNDPRASSQESLLPESDAQQHLRRLLLVYIHGFMGAETSFRSFPAHVHNLLTVLLSETHVIHTKIYPRYASRGKIARARDDFGKWIEPHQDTNTDVVLLGHSMGGLLSAEVVLAPALCAECGPLRHRILGTINFDVPFLGMHPGVVKTGLASIFNPADEPQDQEMPSTTHEDPESSSSRPNLSGPTPSTQRVDTLWAPEKQDPNFNPSFANDVILPVRKGWRNAWHFINKHSDDLTKATKKLVSSHLEFGGAMANYNELKSRYARVRALEESEPKIRRSIVEGGTPPRVRFVNYYTASTGRPKKLKSPHRDKSQTCHNSRPSTRGASPLPDLHASKSTESVVSRQSKDRPVVASAISDSIVDGLHRNQGAGAQQAVKEVDTRVHPPSKPPPLDVSYIQDPGVRELVQREHEKATKAYEDALTALNRAATSSEHTMQQVGASALADESTRGRSPAPKKPVQKPGSEMTHSEQELLRLERERQRMEREGRRLRSEPSPFAEHASEEAGLPSIATTSPVDPGWESAVGTTTEASSIYDGSSLAPSDTRASTDNRSTSEKPKKDRMFCTLPPKDANGERDPTWVRVFMENVDEVGAHCGLFVVDQRYERLVGEVASRIETWVNDDLGERSAHEQG